MTKPHRITPAGEELQITGRSSPAEVISIMGPLRRQRRRFFYNRLADVVVRLGGLGVLFSISAIFLVILVEALPLFLPADTTANADIKLYPGKPLVGAGYVITPNTDRVAVVSGEGVLSVFSAGRPEEKPYEVQLPLPGGAVVSSAVVSTRLNEIVAGTLDGRLLRFELGQFDEKGAIAGTPVKEVRSTEVDPEQRRAVRKLVVDESEGTLTAVLALESNDRSSRATALYSARKQKGLIGGGKLREAVAILPEGENVTASTIGAEGDVLFAGGSDGAIRVYDLRKADRPALLTTTPSVGDPITSMQMLIGGQRLIVGRASGNIEAWMFGSGTAFSGNSLSLVGKFKPHRSPVIDIAPSGRTRQFVTLSSGGEVGVHYGTSVSTDLTLENVARDPSRLAFAPRGDEIFVATQSNVTKSWSLQNPYPEVSLKALFGRVWYEGYSGPTYVWQSSSGSDAFEPKVSLVPLIYGTLKGTFYSLLFAVPIALLGALYTASFMSPRLKAVIKPVVELMAALPSVVIGFIAGLWLAPRLEGYLPGIVLFPVCLVAGICVFFIVWMALPRKVRASVPSGAESMILLPIVVLVTGVAFLSGLFLEHYFLGGSYTKWLSDSLGISYDQRNSLVVGLAMGFAVVPLIFTIAEDSLSSVPSHLSAGSLALGASRWQTAVRVVIPAASPGIFSAIMLGFGRAIGETMIVLMATGNTPVMDISPFNGFRALSANIAVELPEAAVGTTLYRILFFASLLLFIATFLVNTLTEVVRQRLRRRYGQV